VVLDLTLCTAFQQLCQCSRDLWSCKPLYPVFTPPGLPNYSLLFQASILAFLSYGAYNLFFHPLARFPGPPLFCAYYFPFVYLHCTGKVPSHVQSWHATYGPVVRINPNELAFSSPQAWDDIYGLLPGRRQNLKDRWSYHPDQKGILTASTSEHHRKRRAVLAPSFAPKALEEQQALFATFVEKLVNGLHKRIAEGDDVQDLGAWYNWVTFDFNGAFSFGESFQCLEKEEYHPWLKTLLHGLTIGIMLSQLERYGLYSLMVMILPESVFADKHKMNTFAKQHVDTRLAETRAAKVEGEWAGKQADRSDLFRYLLEKGDGPGDSREDMEDLYGCVQ
jgi:Cytochrome P450